jgi:hypothetical protein
MVKQKGIARTIHATVLAAAALVTASSLLAAPTPANAEGTSTAAGSQPKQKARVESSKVAAAASVQWFRNQATGYCITNLGHGLGQIEAHYPCEYNNPSYLWDVTRWKDGTRELRSHDPLYHDACIEAASTGEGPNVILNNCDASTWQSWFVDAWADGTIRFRNQRTGLCLAHYLGNYFTVTQERCDASQSESWY